MMIGFPTRKSRTFLSGIFLKSRVLVHRPLDSVPHSVPGLGTEIKHNVTSVFVTGGSPPQESPYQPTLTGLPRRKPHTPRTDGCNSLRFTGSLARTRTVWCGCRTPLGGKD